MDGALGVRRFTRLLAQIESALADLQEEEEREAAATAAAASEASAHTSEGAGARLSGIDAEVVIGTSAMAEADDT